MVLPFIPSLLGRVTCTECGHDEVRTRAELAVGRRRKCARCGKTYVVKEIRNVASRGTAAGTRARPPKGK